MQISEMGMLYQRVTKFTQSKESGNGTGGMTEQVSLHRVSTRDNED